MIISFRRVFHCLIAKLNLMLCLCITLYMCLLWPSSIVNATLYHLTVSVTLLMLLMSIVTICGQALLLATMMACMISWLKRFHTNTCQAFSEELPRRWRKWPTLTSGEWCYRDEIWDMPSAYDSFGTRSEYPVGLEVLTDLDHLIFKQKASI